MTFQGLHVVAEEESSPPPRTPKRHFSTDYKLAIVEEYDSCGGAGEKAALLRREGLYGSYVHDWRRARDAALDRAGLVLNGAGEPSGDTAPVYGDGAHEAVALTLAIRRIQELETELARARALIDIQRRARVLLDVISENRTRIFPDASD